MAYATVAGMDNHIDLDIEPVYYASTAFSGVGFLLPGESLPEGAVEIDAIRVHPDIREQGIAHMKERLSR